MGKSLLLFLFLPFSAFAFSIGGIYFGGKITTITFCCNGLMLTIDRYYRPWPGGPPTLHEVGTYLFQNGPSRLIVGNLSVGKWVLGKAYPGGVCLVGHGGLFSCPCCVPLPTMYTIDFIGTNK